MSCVCQNKPLIKGQQDKETCYQKRSISNVIFYMAYINIALQRHVTIGQWVMALN